MKKIDEMITKTQIINDLKKIGIKKGMTIIVHTSLSSIGWIVGGPITVIQAIQEVVTDEGTLVMPAHSAEISDPKNWSNPPVNKKLWKELKAEMPAFDARLSPTYQIGIVAEIFRTFPEVLRSNHPVYSFCAWGKYSSYIIENQSLDNGLGELSPLAKIYELDGSVLLLGTNYDSNTSMHLSEHRVGVFPDIKQSSPVLINNLKVWKEFTEIEYDEASFNKIGKKFEERHSLNLGLIGNAPSKLIRQRDIVDFTTENILRYQ